ncbi:MAG: DoxX family protein [Dolichospermum sp.]|nr:DoxX family protein [Dolichospermum sp.]
MNKSSTIILWIVKIVAAIILLQTLFFKFTAAPESVEIFTRVGIEPYGRIGTGVLELIAAILILIPATAYLGAGLALGLMVGAIGAHLTILGIVVMDDGGQLFIYAVLVAISAAIILWFEREKITAILNKFI